MRFFLKLPSANFLSVIHDCIMAALSFALALYLRLGYPRMLTYAHSYILEGMVVFGGMVLLSMLYFRTYRRVWRYTSLSDLLIIARAGTIAITAFYFTIYIFPAEVFLPRSLPLIHWMTLMLCLATARTVWRLAHDRVLFAKFTAAQPNRVPVLLIGATPQAEMFIRESERNADFPYRAVGLVDDDRRQHGREIHHVRIYGSIHEMGFVLRKLARKNRAPQRLLLTDPNVARGAFESLLAIAETHHLSIARLPNLSELKAGDRVHDVRPVAVEDILGRPQAVLDYPAIRAFVTGKRVLITGAGGSIGSELTRQIARLEPASVLLYDQSEYQLYSIDQELSEIAPEIARRPVIGDVRDVEHLNRQFAEFRPEVVFHAAAIKHVPLSESNPEQAVLTNILGGKHVADACVAHGVAAMVQISTDKAVNPMSVMGATKRAAEIYCQALAQSGAATRFITVRFGNVLNSAGSVVPLFQKQIARGGPITVTHRDMIRYFMTIGEAVQLVLQAAALGADTSEGAPIFVLDMGEPVRIEELACQMIRLMGLKPYEDIAIHFTGLRPGEKLFEELFHDAENLVATRHASIRLARARTVSNAEVLAHLETLVDAAHGGNHSTIRPLLHRLIPEYQLPTSEAA